MSRSFVKTLLPLVLIAFIQVDAISQSSKELNAAAAKLAMREIGPALMGGRISDIAIHPNQPHTWYVAAGSGNLWKTTNRGTTWKPIFDDQQSYSIGDVATDPNNPNVIWVGTGENVSGRHVGWGNGIYKSKDGGKTWVNMGLKASEHIGKILVDPSDSDIIYVASEGPLWSSGGERGVYKSIDGGKSWQSVLSIDKYTGVTDIEFDPSNPKTIYAATYQRFRRTWALMAGGPNSGIYKSSDAGTTWTQLKHGLPSVDMGKIGLAVTPANPNLVYATIEANDQNKGFYRSDDRGESWKKQNTYISGGTGPHYYQEIEASPQDANLVYQMDVFLHVTRDGGKSFDYLTNGRTKHSDNHALWIDPSDDSHLIAGTDGGLYESYDQGDTWRHFNNLPISQFYKLGLDNSLPFYNIVAGAQDLGTLIGPSRTTNTEGIRNRDWYVPLGADGYGSVYDWKDSNTAYMMWQQGSLVRLNVKTGETMGIKPQPVDSEVPERWNWDSPILVSPHNNKRIYFGSQRLWKSENQGNEWEAVSEDLTTNTNRYELPLMDRVWSVDDLYDNGAMSKYATLTTIAESPVQEGLLYTGSDDGYVHTSEDGGETWKRGNLSIPERSFINDIEASQHDPNVVFVAVDAHKLGDYRPYLFKSNDKGKSWKSIVGDLPSETIIWSIKQDHEDPELLFIGTEFGIYFSYNAGVNWIKLQGGVPTIPFRDLAIQKRNNDLVGASFGRGIYVLDDYSPLRTLKEVVDAKSSTALPVRDAWWYIPTVPMQAVGMPSQGSSHYVAENPPYGAIISYYLSESTSSNSDQRMEREKELGKNKADIPFPGWKELNEEKKESEPRVLLLIRDEAGNAVRWVDAKNEKGLHRVSWDLRYPAPNPIRLTKPAFQPPWASDPVGPLVPPGTYSVELFVTENGRLTGRGSVHSFEVKPIPTLEKLDFKAIAAFQSETRNLMLQITSFGASLGEANDRLRYIEAGLRKATTSEAEHFSTVDLLKRRIGELQFSLYGDPARNSLDESTLPGIQGRVGAVAWNHWNTTQLPSETLKQNLAQGKNDFDAFKADAVQFFRDMEAFESELKEIGVPYTKGRGF